MRRNDSWLGAGSVSSYSRGSHYKDSRSSFAGLSRVIVVLVILIVAASVIQLLRPIALPTLHTSVGDAVIPGAPPSLPWPSQGGGEVMIQNVGIIGSFNADTELPLASVAKIITGLVIVKDHPLVLGGTGPTLKITPSDVASYQTMVQQQDSVMGVVNGENLNEYQLLEALLVPSADNIAIKLANWDAGSVPAFVAKMNSMAKSLGMTKTIFKDPSGLDSGTVGTAHDQVLAALSLLKNPVLAQIVAKPQASLPVAGVVYNVNYNVGHDGFVGVKTGSMGSGGNLVFAATGAASKDLIVGAVLGQTGVQPLIAALSESTKLVDAARKIPTEFSVLKKGQAVASISVPGGRSVTVDSAGGASLLGWPGLRVTYVVKFSKLSHKIPTGTRVGSLTVTVGSQTSTVSLVTTAAVQNPSMMWRLERL